VRRIPKRSEDGAFWPIDGADIDAKGEFGEEAKENGNMMRETKSVH
jgi:hypothetical protein